MRMPPENAEARDPLYRGALRELRWILAAWAVNFAWVIGYCRVAAFRVEPGEPATVWGMPSWVFWGVFLPWIAVTAFTAWFALTRMEDQPLGETDDE